MLTTQMLDHTKCSLHNFVVEWTFSIVFGESPQLHKKILIIFFKEIIGFIYFFLCIFLELIFSYFLTSQKLEKKIPDHSYSLFLGGLDHSLAFVALKV